MHLDSRGRYSTLGRYCYPLTRRDWEEQRHNIERIYTQDGKTLRILKNQMSEDYGFQASYSTRELLTVFCANALAKRETIQAEAFQMAP